MRWCLKPPMKPSVVLAVVLGAVQSLRAKPSSATPPECAEIAQHTLQQLFDEVRAPCDNVHDQRACAETLDLELLKLTRAIPLKCRRCPVHTVIVGFEPQKDRVGLDLLIRSFLVTQPEDAVLNVWTAGGGESELRRALASCNSSGRVRVRDKLDGAFMARMESKNPAAADMARFHILVAEGGIYVDADTVFLRSMSALCDATFAYRWSYADYYNTAVFGCPRNCSYGRRLIQRHGLHYHESEYHPHSLKRRDALIRLPSRMFDPLWLAGDGRDRGHVDAWKAGSETVEWTLGKEGRIVQTKTVGKSTRDRDMRLRRLARQFATLGDIYSGALTFHWHGGLRARWLTHPESAEFVALLRAVLRPHLSPGTCAT